MIVLALVGVDAARRAAQRRPRGTFSERLQTALLMTLVITSAGGLGLLVGGSGPTESLHVLYAILALGSLPVADSLVRRSSPRRQAVTTLVAALVAAVLVARLFQTG